MGCSPLPCAVQAPKEVLVHTALQEKQQELFTLLGCFHSFDLVLNPDSSWAHPSVHTVLKPKLPEPDR